MDDCDIEIGDPPGRDKTTKTETTTMNLPSGKLMALIAVFAAIGVITGTGAFTTVTAQRTAQVSVAGDGSALLGLQPHSGSNGQTYATVSGGTLQLQNLQKVNLNALTEINYVFNITNNGAQEIEVWIEANTTNAGSDDMIEFYNGSVAGSNSGTVIESPDNAEVLSSGETTTISIEIDTRGAGLGKNTRILNGITIHAEATS